MHFQPTIFFSSLLALSLNPKTLQVFGMIGDDEKNHKNTECALVLEHNGVFICSASLVFDDNDFQFVLTSAKCLWNGRNTPDSHWTTWHLQLYGWTPNFRKVEGLLRQVRKVIIHPGFDPRYLKHDLAILFIEKPYDYIAGQFNPCRLPKPGYKVAGGVLMMGFGAQNIEYITDGSLGKVVVPHVSHDICTNFGHTASETDFCVGWLGKGGSGPCDGDEGGPALARHSLEHHYYLAGIYSHTPAFGTKYRASCADPRVPSIVTNIATHMDWITAEIQKKDVPNE